MKRVVDVFSLGCAKNLVDAERLMKQLEQSGYDVCFEPAAVRGGTVIVNTCAFIDDAKEESIAEILRHAEAKSAGSIERLYVMGCLSQRYRDELRRELDEVDGFFGKWDFPDLVMALDGDSPIAGRNVDARRVMGFGDTIKRRLTTPSHYAYLKVAEGCDRHCSYCIIPNITGRLRSREPKEVLDEVRWLVDEGVRELVVIAQDLTAWGSDLDKGENIANLVSRIADVNGVEWIRLHYAYPKHFPWALLDVIRERENVCYYLDVALQHVADDVLKRMRRHLTRDDTYEFVELVRKECPGIALRTTMMTGFAGESERDFEELIRFVKWARFERLGAFAYSEEEGTWSAAHLEDDVPREVKQWRVEELMRVQQQISEEMMMKEVGKRYKTIFDRREGDYYVGRNEYSSPEVDPEILVRADDGAVQAGKFYNVEITESTPFDLYGRIVDDIKQLRAR